MSTILDSQLHTALPTPMPTPARAAARSAAILLVALTLTAGVLIALASIVDTLA